MPLITDRRLTARAGGALALANIRYWLRVAPLVRVELRRWREHAEAIPDPALRALALHKLDEEHFTAEVAATLGTLAPRPYRSDAVQAIVALEIMYDYLDGLTEQPSRDPLRDGAQLFQAFLLALGQDGGDAGDYYRYRASSDDGGYLDELVAVTRAALARLPASAIVAETLQRAAARGAAAQTRAHAVPRAGRAQIEQWASREAETLQVPWREFLAGAASSVAAVHALIAAACHERTTAEQAADTDAAYLSIAAVATMVDSLVDYEEDAASGSLALGYMQYFDDRKLARELAASLRSALARIQRIPNSGHHLMTLVGVVAYYTSEPGGKRGFARAAVSELQHELGPLIWPTLAIMRAWRLARRARHSLTRRSLPHDRQPLTVTRRAGSPAQAHAGTP
jgi:tetraprenyl-beta-curcumene synthase